MDMKRNAPDPAGGTRRAPRSPQHGDTDGGSNADEPAKAALPVAAAIPGFALRPPGSDTAATSGSSIFWEWLP
jgi:hypothetical protein